MKTIGKILIAMIITMSFIANTFAGNISSSPAKVNHGKLVATWAFPWEKSYKKETVVGTSKYKGKVYQGEKVYKGTQGVKEIKKGYK